MDFKRFSISDFKKSIADKLQPNKIFRNKRVMIGIAFALAFVLVFTVSFLISHDSSSSEAGEDTSQDSFNKDSTRKTLPKRDSTTTTTTKDDKEDLDLETLELSTGYEKISAEELSEGVRVKLGKGGILEFDLDSTNHEIFVDFVSVESMEITIKSIPIFATLKVGEPRKFDLDKNNNYDLEIELLEIAKEEGLVDIRGISEEYLLTLPNATDEEFSDWTYLTVNYVPYSCTEQIGFVDYSYLEVFKSGSTIVDEQRYDVRKENICTSISSLREYSCGLGNTFESNDRNCESRYEDCDDGKCVVVRYERNIGKSNSPIESYSGENECHLVVEDTTFWASMGKDACRDLFIASKFFIKSDFLDLLSSLGYDTSIIENYFILPHYVEISHSSSLGDLDYFEETENKFDSDKCESLNYFGIDTYCFNRVINEKDNNLEYIVSLLTLLGRMDEIYDSLLVDVSPYDFLKDNNIIFIDGETSSIYDGSFLGYDSNCVAGSATANYQKLNSKNNVFICDGIFGYSTLNSHRVAYSAVLYREALKVIEGKDEKCYSDTVMIPCDKTIECDCCDDWGDWDEFWNQDDIDECEEYDDSDVEDECTIEEKDNWCDDHCNDWDKCIRVIPDADTCLSPVSYNDFNSIQGEYVNYLYGMSKNDKLLCSDRQAFYSIAVSELNNFGCANGTAPDYISMVSPSC